jgi:diaminohydroxyphosphoribosylaminopyrimidine deaminase/5-amino-6-(5-phosphoribosylamino)uracil reductase
MAGVAAAGSTAYVTLEPCSHHGRTPPCCDALIAAGVARVVVGAGDPDPRVNGAGLARLQEAGIAVTAGILRDEAEEVVAGFRSRVKLGRPLVTLKLATTLDGRIATRSGESQWITGPEARREAHALRGRHDAVLVGVGTVLADDPQLTCRIPGYKHMPMVRVIVDSQLRTPATCELVATAKTEPTWIVTREDADKIRRDILAERGARLIEIAGSNDGLDLAKTFAALGDSGITSVLAEGGASMAASLIRAGLVDRVAWFHAPAVMGGDGLPATQAFAVDRLSDMPRFHRTGSRAIGADTLTELRRSEACLPVS